MICSAGRILSIVVVFTTFAADAPGHGSCPELELHDLLRRQILVDRGVPPKLLQLMLKPWICPELSRLTSLSLMNFDVLLLRSGELFDCSVILQNSVQGSVAIVAGSPSYCTP